MFIFAHKLKTIFAVSIGSEYAIFHTGSELKEMCWHSIPCSNLWSTEVLSHCASRTSGHS
jgi:hypothetical protein